MTIRYTPELLEYMDKKNNHTILVEMRRGASLLS